jgi:PAS domain-containing protein
MPSPEGGRSVVAEPCATWSMDVPSRRVWGNPTLALFFGLPEGPVENVSLGILLAGIHPGDAVRVVALIEASIAANSRYETVYRVLGRDRPRTIVARGRVERDDDGLPLRHTGEARELVG